jgi:hypothetical protein
MRGKMKLLVLVVVGLVAWALFIAAVFYTMMGP